MQYCEFFIIIRCKRDLPCIFHLARLLLINVKNYWNCPCKLITQPACTYNTVEIMLAYESFKGTKNSIRNVFNVVAELIAYLQRIHVVYIFLVRDNKSVYELACVGRWNRSSQSPSLLLVCSFRWIKVEAAFFLCSAFPPPPPCTWILSRL